MAPSRFRLAQNYPNPFRDQTTIKYCVAYRCRVVLKICDGHGNVVRLLIDNEKSAGTYEVLWDARGLAGGIYVCEMKAGSFVSRKYMRLMV